MSDAFHFAVIAGGVAKAAGSPLSANPHKREGVLWKCWRAGYFRDGTVSRETKPGRGRSVNGPRSEWSVEELRELEQFASANVTQEVIGLVLGRSHQAVRGALHRLRKRAA